MLRLWAGLGARRSGTRVASGMYTSTATTHLGKDARTTGEEQTETYSCSWTILLACPVHVN